MTNKERQKSLDKKKWLESEKIGFDMSGKMNYCDACVDRYLFEERCGISQEERESTCRCASAYNRMKRWGYKDRDLMVEIDIDKFVKERDEMLLKRDVNELRKFVREHTKEYEPFFIMAIEGASDDVLEITLHKMIANVTSIPADFAEESVKWLLERGYSPYF